MNIKQDIQFFNAITAAGFGLTNFKSIGTDDGACWTATLAYGRTKLVTASNGGYGGPDECNFVDVKTTSRTAQKELIDKFWMLPCVVESVRNYSVELLELDKQFGNVTVDEFEKRKSEILTEQPKFDFEMLASVICHITDSSDVVKKFKRSTATKICYVQKSTEAKGEYFMINAPDTEQNRERVKSRVGADFAYFIADILAGKY